MQNIEKELDKEIDIYSEIVSCSKQKREFLIKCDMEGLKNIDEKINALSLDLSKIISKRDRNLRLKEVIESVKDKDTETAKRLEGKRQDLENIFLELQHNEKANRNLISNSLKLVEKTLTMIASFLIPETASYNTLGKKSQSNETISSIIEEA